MDLFEKYITKYKEIPVIKRALTCKSYRNKHLKDTGKILLDHEVNDELATLGDALLRFLLCEKFLDKKDQLSKYIQKYLTDKNLIEIIGNHYNLIDYLYYDTDNKEIETDYVYDKGDNHKYIATSIEALLGAIYLYNKNLDDVRQIVNRFISLVDEKLGDCIK